MILVALKKGNHLGKALREKGPKKRFIQNREELLRGPHEEAEIQRKALR